MYENMKVTIQNHEADVCAGVMGVCSEVVYISLKLLKQPAVFWKGKKEWKKERSREKCCIVKVCWIKRVSERKRVRAIRNLNESGLGGERYRERKWEKRGKERREELKERKEREEGKEREKRER